MKKIVMIVGLILTDHMSYTGMERAPEMETSYHATTSNRTDPQVKTAQKAEATKKITYNKDGSRVERSTNISGDSTGTAYKTDKSRTEKIIIQNSGIEITKNYDTSGNDISNQNNNVYDKTTLPTFEQPTTIEIVHPEDKGWWSTKKASTTIKANLDGTHSIITNENVKSFLSNKTKTTETIHTGLKLQTIEQQLVDSKGNINIIKDIQSNNPTTSIVRNKDGSRIEQSTDKLGNKIVIKYKQDDTKETEYQFDLTGVTVIKYDNNGQQIKYNSNGTETDRKYIADNSVEIDNNGNIVAPSQSLFNLFS